MNFKIISLIVLKHQEVSSQDAILRRKKSCWTEDSLNSSLKVVPDSNLTPANTVGENLTTITRNVIIRSDVAVEKG